MANGYTCANCGWQESSHENIRLEARELEEARRVKEGCTHSLIGERSCPGYCPPEEEERFEKTLEAGRDWISRAVASRVD